MAKVTKVRTEAGTRYVVDYYDESGTRHRVFFERRHNAEEYQHRRGQEVAHFRRYGERVRKGTNPLFRDFVGRYLAAAPNMRKGGTLSPASLDRATLAARHLCEFMGHKRLAQVSEEDVAQYSKTRRDAGATLATLARELTTLKAILHYAVNVGELVRGIEIKLPDPRRFLAPARFLSRKECRAVTELADRDLADLIRVAVNTGLRRGELFRLTWSQVDLETRTLSVLETKSGWPRTVPLNAECSAVLAEIPRAIDDPRVFAWWGRMKTAERGIWRRFKTTLKRAGVERLRFHDLRHTFASWAVMEGVDLRTVAKWLGHRSLDLVMRYSHLAASHEREMIERISGSTGQQPGSEARKAHHAV
jgi:integrase